MVEKYVLVNGGSGVRKLISTSFIAEVMGGAGDASFKTVDGSWYKMNEDLDSYMRFLTGNILIFDAT